MCAEQRERRGTAHGSNGVGEVRPKGSGVPKGSIDSMQRPHGRQQASVPPVRTAGFHHRQHPYRLLPVLSATHCVAYGVRAYACGGARTAKLRHRAYARSRPPEPLSADRHTLNPVRPPLHTRPCFSTHGPQQSSRCTTNNLDQVGVERLPGSSPTSRSTGLVSSVARRSTQSHAPSASKGIAKRDARAEARTHARPLTCTHTHANARTCTRTHAQHARMEMHAPTRMHARTHSRAHGDNPRKTASTWQRRCLAVSGGRDGADKSSTTRCNAVQHVATQHNTLQRSTPRCNALRHAAAGTRKRSTSASLRRLMVVTSAAASRSSGARNTKRQSSQCDCQSRCKTWWQG